MQIKAILTILSALFIVFVACAVPLEARELERRIPMLDEPLDELEDEASVYPEPAYGIFGVSQVSADTFYYGGTVVGPLGVLYADEPSGPGWVNRKMWTWSPSGFNGTPHSGLNMDGWSGVDNTTDYENHFKVQDNASLGTTCIIAGDKSLFCGATHTECLEQCYSDLTGTGYGNNWRQSVATRGYTYAPGAEITLVYGYTNQTEPGADFTYVILQTYDSGTASWSDQDTLATYQGVVAGSASLDVDASLITYVEPVDFRVLFLFCSDGGYSDRDAYYPTACGACAFDDYALTGDVTDTEDFEGVPIGELPAGWTRVVEGVGDYSAVKHLGELALQLSLDPCVVALPQTCAIADSVLVMYDPGAPEYPHPLHQDNYVVSPVVDVSSHPEFPGKILRFDRFASLDPADYVFMYWLARCRPACPAGGWSGWCTDNYVYYSREGTSCASLAFDISPYITPSAEQVQIALGVINLCDDPMGCTFTCNITPYYDNVTLATFGSEAVPHLGMSEHYYWQDQFAEDGTLSPSSTADTRIADCLGDLVPPIFGDTLHCRGSADDMEVYFVFRMAKVGPAQAETHSFFSSWFPGVTGGNWYEARMDTAEFTDWCEGDVPCLKPSPGVWMCAFHESDPVAVANGLLEGREILPNNLFVPGTRIEYFLKSKYTGSPAYFTLPDTTGGGYEEFEILPMMREDAGAPSGVSWPCFLVADHFGGRGNWGERNSDRISKHLALNNVDFDVFNKLGPSYDLKNGIGRWAANPGQVGGPGTAKYNWGPGATLNQLCGYNYCLLNTGDVYNYCVYKEDIDVIDPWLTVKSGPEEPRFLWLSGNQVCRELNRGGAWGGSAFLNNVLCATYVSSIYSDYTGDYNYCLPMVTEEGSRVIGGGHYEAFLVRTLNCPRNQNGLNVIGISGAAGCAGVAELRYHPGLGGETCLAAVSNAPEGEYYKTLVESFDNCLMRMFAAKDYPTCGYDNYMTRWYGFVLRWVNYDPLSCLGHVTPHSLDSSPAAATLLEQAFPNPPNPRATIRYTLASSGRVTLKIFDVSGRVVRTLVDADQLARPEPYELTWDGKNDLGERVASGVLFYRLDAPGHRSAKKIVIVR